MLRIFSSRPAWGSQVLLGILLLFVGISAPSAAQDSKPDAKQFRAYLPTIRKKALLDNERDHTAALERCLQLYEVFLEGGLANQLEKGRVEEGLLRKHIRVLQRDTDYRDSVDEFTSRVRVISERREQMEDMTLSPLTNLFQRYEDLAHDFQEVQYGLLQMGRPEDVAKLRPAVVRFLTASCLVKGTALPKRFLAKWRAWEKIDDVNKVRQQRGKHREDCSQLRARQAELQRDKKELSEDDRLRLKNLAFQTDLGDLEYYLRVYESQTWKVIGNELDRMERQNADFRRILVAFMRIVDEAYSERFDRLHRSWPVLASLKLKEVDLLACGQDEAERTVSSSLKSAEAQLAGKKKVRRLRSLADSYRKILTRLFELTFLQREQVFQGWQTPAPRPSRDVKGIGPVASVEGPRKDPFAAELVLGALSSFAATKQQLLETWIDYQMVRLDLYSDFGLAPP